MSYKLASTKDKVICGLLYSAIFIPVMAWAPIIWLIIINVRQMTVKDFIRYHCYQALLFNMIAFFLPSLLAAVINFIATFLSLFVIFDNTILLLQSLTNGLIPIYFWIIRLAAIYALIWTIRGKYTDLPPISQAVNMLLR